MSSACTPRNASDLHVAEIDAESGACGEERALMERLAVDERAVDIPGDGAKQCHGIPERPFSAGAPRIR